jgi:hypothetical protein
MGLKEEESLRVKKQIEAQAALKREEEARMIAAAKAREEE